MVCFSMLEGIAEAASDVTVCTGHLWIAPRVAQILQARGLDSERRGGPSQVRRSAISSYVWRDVESRAVDKEI